jgi:transposase InsO family protein
MSEDDWSQTHADLTETEAYDRPGVRGAEPPEILSKKTDPPESLPGGRSERGAAARSGERDVAGRRRYTAAERRELLAAFESSGSSVPEFCAAHGLHESTLYGWRRGVGQGRRGRRASTKKSTATYTPEQRRSAVEAFARSGRTRAEFAALWGISTATLSSWLKRYEEEGPKGLETRRRAGPGRPRTIPEAVRDEIAATKRRFPDFGARRVRDWLRRFRGIRVAQGTVHKTLVERDLVESAPRPKPRRSKKPPRRFERARPMQLWQSDITSYVLTRHHTRVYLVVFLDDRSRYVVSWSLCTHQKTQMVQECLLDGIARFGKPDEVLTDQGPQYHSWRGRSAFDKLLDREGIRHVVARTHHPQTLGKCERLWRTVDEEFWQRAKPQDLAEARERMGHYFAHYNHFRPHQGIDGLVPADRFFGADDAVRASLEEHMSKDELRAALEDAPRQSLYLFGQIGDRQVSLHGERGRVVVRTEQGELCEMAMDRMGVERTETTKEIGDERGDDGRGDGTEHAGQHEHRDEPPSEADARGAQAHALHGLPTPGDPGARPVGAGEPGGEAEGAHHVHGDPGVLARQGEQGPGRRAPGGAAAAGVAALPAGPERHAGGALAPAQDAPEGDAPAGDPGGGSNPPQAPDRGPGEEARAHGGPGAGAQGPPVGQAGGVADDGGDDLEREGRPRCSKQARPSASWGAGIQERLVCASGESSPQE